MSRQTTMDKRCWFAGGRGGEGESEHCQGLRGRKNPNQAQVWSAPASYACLRRWELQHSCTATQLHCRKAEYVCMFVCLYVCMFVMIVTWVAWSVDLRENLNIKKRALVVSNTLFCQGKAGLIQVQRAKAAVLQYQGCHRYTTRYIDTGGSPACSITKSKSNDFA